MLEHKGVPGVVERTLIRPPSSQLGPISKETRAAMVSSSDLGPRYDTATDRHSAYEILKARADTAAKEAEAAETAAEEASTWEREFNAARRYSGQRVSRSSARRTRKPDNVADALASAVIKELSGTTGRRLVRGILGGLFKGR